MQIEIPDEYIKKAAKIIAHYQDLVKRGLSGFTVQSVEELIESCINREEGLMEITLAELAEADEEEE
jgi:hypothetical protein